MQQLVEMMEEQISVLTSLSVTHTDGFYLNNSAVEHVVDENGLRDELTGAFLEHHSTVASVHPRHQQLAVSVRQRITVVQLHQQNISSQLTAQVSSQTVDS